MGSSTTGALVSRTHARDASKEHKSDLTIEKGTPISHREEYFKPPGASKLYRPRSPSASDMFEEIPKRPYVISEGPQPSTLYQPPDLTLHPKSQSGTIHTFGRAHFPSDQYLTNGAYQRGLLRRYGSLDVSLPSCSLTGFQKSETGITNPFLRYNGNFFINTSEILSYKWENFVPFQPSFSWTKSDFVAQTPDNSLVDSINPTSKAGSEEMKISPESSPVATSNNISGIGENSPNYNLSNSFCKVKTKIAPSEEVLNEVSSSNNKADRAWTDRSGSRESAELKKFRAALVEFIKELVKPAWKNGILSNDAHKMLVKKACDKVVSSVQPHQVPSSQESAKQYISMYKPKIEKLVEDYLKIYGKTKCPAKSIE